jgi:acyl transferase domain-containing protein
MLAEFERVATQVTYATPQIPLCSNITGQLAKDEIATPAYWCLHVRQPVRFAASMETLYQQGYECFIEIGPKPSLLGMGRLCIPDNVGTWLVSLRQGQDDWQQLLQSLSELYIHGVPIDWFGFDKDYPRRRLQLPTYPFQRQRYWIETAKAVAHKEQHESAHALHPLWKNKMQSPLLKEIVFETQFSSSYPSFIAEHIILEKLVVPGANHISMLLGAAALSFGEKAYVLENLLFLQPLVIEAGETRTVQAILTPENESEQYAVKLISFNQNHTKVSAWTEHLSGSLLNKAHIPQPVVSLPTPQAPSQQGTVLYQKTVQQHHYQLGTSFRWIESIWQENGDILCRLTLPENVENLEEYQLYPPILDSCIHIFLATVKAEEELIFVPFRVEKFAYYQRPSMATPLWCYATFKKAAPSDKEQLLMDTRLCDDSGQVLAEAIGLEFIKSSRSTLQRSLEKEPSSAQAQQQPQFIKQLESAPAKQRRDLLLKHVRSQIGKVAGLRTVEQIQPRQRLFDDLGLDSLMAVELRYNLEDTLEQTLYETLVFDYPTLEALVNYLFHDVLGLSEESQAAKPEPADESEENSTELEVLSKEEIGALLDEKLAYLNS